MIALSSVKSGEGGTVAALKTEDETLLRKLMAMGVSPGISITLEQRFPSYIIKVGRTRAAGFRWKFPATRGNFRLKFDFIQRKSNKHCYLSTLVVLDGGGTTL